MRTVNNREPRVSESLLAHIWKGQWIQKGPLPASDGRVVRVRSTGRENKDSGPDFLGATILFDDEILTGDVELHVKSSDWRSHGHHLDPHFNGVILQVVLWDDAKLPAQLQNSNTIPTLSLHDYLNGSMDELSVRAEAKQAPLAPCRGAGEYPGYEQVARVLDEHGQERFYIKSAFFEVGLIIEEPVQVLYQGIMGALGYTRNKEAFQQLAHRLPFQVLESIALEQEKGRRTLTLQALLLGGAGLLPSQCEGKSRLGKFGEISKLEEVWHSLKIGNAMSYADWHFFRMHPKNFPTSRLLAAGWLLERYMNGNLLNDVLYLVKNANPGKDVISIENSFIITDLLGRERAREITINVVLPFSAAWAEANSHRELKEHVLDLYQAYPRMGENQITRYLKSLFWDKAKSKVPLSAQQQQGMILLYKTFCETHRCESCPLNSEVKPALGSGPRPDPNQRSCLP